MSKCIEWTGTINSRGYGVKWNTKTNNWRVAHRWVWEETNGPIPKGMLLRHLCHNKKCVNLEHLAIGTMKDNRQDDIDAGKDWFIGENNNLAKLTEQQVLDIRSRQPNGKPPYGYIRDLAKEYNLNRSQIYDIWKRNVWKHI